MRNNVKKYYVLLAVVSALSLAACGKKSSPAPASQSAQKQEEKVPVLPSVASQLNTYQVIDFGKSVEYKDFMNYRALFMKLAASDKSFDGKKFTEMALMDVGAESDAFKREDLAKQGADAVTAIQKSSISKAFLADSTATVFPMAGSVSAYNMENETYTITLGIDGFRIGYNWQEKNRNYEYKFNIDTPSISRVATCFECSKNVDIVVKVPKEKAREIEGKLSSLRGSGNNSALIPAGYYVSVSKIDETSNWERASVRANVDAIALRLPGQPVESALILIDGPDLKRK